MEGRERAQGGQGGYSCCRGVEVPKDGATEMIPNTTFGKLGEYYGFHVLDPLGDLVASRQPSQAAGRPLQRGGTAAGFQGRLEIRIIPTSLHY